MRLDQTAEAAAPREATVSEREALLLRLPNSKRPLVGAARLLLFSQRRQPGDRVGDVSITPIAGASLFLCHEGNRPRRPARTSAKATERASTPCCVGLVGWLCFRPISGTVGRKRGTRTIGFGTSDRLDVPRADANQGDDPSGRRWGGASSRAGPVSNTRTLGSWSWPITLTNTTNYARAPAAPLVLST